jgi:hypothetical protein
MSTEQSKQQGNEHCLRQQTSQRLIADLTWSLLPGTWDASVVKSHAQGRRSSKPIHINGSGRLETQAMAITEGNCCEPER